MSSSDDDDIRSFFLHKCHTTDSCRYSSRLVGWTGGCQSNTAIFLGLSDRINEGRGLDQLCRPRPPVGSTRPSAESPSVTQHFTITDGDDIYLHFTDFNNCSNDVEHHAAVCAQELSFCELFTRSIRPRVSTHRFTHTHTHTCSEIMKVCNLDVLLNNGSIKYPTGDILTQTTSLPIEKTENLY